MFMVLSSCYLHGTAIARIHPVHLLNAEQRQMTTELWSLHKANWLEP